MLGLIFSHLRAKLSYYLGNVPVLAAILCFLLTALICFLVYCVYTKRKPGSRAWIAFLLVSAYATFVLSITLLGRTVTEPGKFHDLTVTVDLLRQGKTDTLFDIYFNVAMLVPMGVLTAYKLRLLPSCLLFLVTTGSIETAQMLTGRGVFEVTDLMANFLGGILGYGLYKLAKEIKRRNELKKALSAEITNADPNVGDT